MLDFAAAWCIKANDELERVGRALASVHTRREEAIGALASFVEQAKANPAFADGGLLRRGVAATLSRFESLVLQHLSLEHFDGYTRIEKAREAFGSAGERKWSPQQGDADLRQRLGALKVEIDEVRLEISGSSSGADPCPGLDLPTVLNNVRHAAPSKVSDRTDLPTFYVPETRRADRKRIAAWTLGILFVLALLFQGIFVVGFLGAGLWFGAQFVMTTRVDEEQRTAQQDRTSYEQGLKERLLDLDGRTKSLIELLLNHTEYELDRTAEAANEACAAMLNIAGNAEHRTPPDGSLVFGECAISPVVRHMTRQSRPGFLLYAVAGLRLEDFIEDPEPIVGCRAHLPVAECDAIEVMVEPDADASATGTMLAAAALAASKPGRTRFMFIEPGRLAEAYRVYGPLNESASTRLADRLYVTHVSELTNAVDALRTFVGRTKEAVTRHGDANRRVGDAVAEDGFHLQRAVVVLDETQHQHWPEKDKRRLLEYFAEVRALAQVGAREGSVLLIELRSAPQEPQQYRPTTGTRDVGIRAGADGLLFEGTVLTLYPVARSSAAIGGDCDLWVSNAKKADSKLLQTGAALDWSDEQASNTRYGIEVDIGRYGANRPARLVLGREGSHHAICIGRTGSGKTNLFHVIISNLIRRYSPEELELYLLDFKEGVEFAVYADLALPHCRAVAIDADRGFGLSVLTHLKRELNRRAGIFKAAGVGIASLERYEEVTGINMPRIVLLIDEFQVLLQAGERMAGAAPGAAAATLEDLVRRGRSFGLHVILGSQTLAGRELTAATLGQLAVRIVLPCSTADAAALLGEQPISGQLRAPGDAIVWRAGLGDVSDSHLAKIFAAALDDLPSLAETSRAHLAREGKPIPAPFVFRGSGQNDIGEVMPHLEAFKQERNERGASVFALGAPTAYGDRPAGVLRDSRARNLLFVHRTEQTRADFLYSSLESLLRLDLLCQVVICDPNQPTDLMGNSMSARLQHAFEDRVRLVEAVELEAEISSLAADRHGASGAPRTVLAIAASPRIQLARSQSFAESVREGPEAGLHFFVSCDTVKNLERLFERPILSEFGIRGLGPASASDSQKLLEATDAETLTADHHYLLFDDGTPGRLARLQVLTPAFEPPAEVELRVAEVNHV